MGACKTRIGTTTGDISSWRVQEAPLHHQDILGIGGLRFKVLFGDVTQVDSATGEHVTQTRAMIENMAQGLPGPHLNADVPQRKAS